MHVPVYFFLNSVGSGFPSTQLTQSRKNENYYEVPEVWQIATDIPDVEHFVPIGSKIKIIVMFSQGHFEKLYYGI